MKILNKASLKDFETCSTIKYIAFLPICSQFLLMSNQVQETEDNLQSIKFLFIYISRNFEIIKRCIWQERILLLITLFCLPYPLTAWREKDL